MKVRTDWADPVLPTDLTWNPRVYSRVRKPSHRGALVGSLFGVQVDGNTCGRGTVYQFQTLNGDVHTVWWDGTMYGDTPYLHNVDTDARVLVAPAAVAWFCHLEDVRIPDSTCPTEKFRYESLVEALRSKMRGAPNHERLIASLNEALPPYLVVLAHVEARRTRENA